MPGYTKALPMKNMDHMKVSVTSTSSQALASNNDRRYVLLQNNSDVDMFIKLGSTAVVDEGILIGSNGGHFEIHESNLWHGIINVIKTGAGSEDLLVTEGT